MFNRKIKHFKTNKRLAFLYIFFFQQIKNSGHTILCNFAIFLNFFLNRLETEVPALDNCAA